MIQDIDTGARAWAQRLQTCRLRAAQIRPRAQKKRCQMLWTITVVLLVLWLLGLTGAYTIGAWVHVLLVLAIISVLINLAGGFRRV
jgi:hypothetical protein